MRRNAGILFSVFAETIKVNVDERGWLDIAENLRRSMALDDRKGTDVLVQQQTATPRYYSSPIIQSNYQVL